MLDAFQNPQQAGFETILLNGTANDAMAARLIKQIIVARDKGKAGAWIGIQCQGGAPGAARLVHDYISSTDFAVVGHIHEAFSEGASLAAAFRQRSISPTGKVGFHQVGMNLIAAQYHEAQLSDLLQQVKGHNRAMIEHLNLALGAPKNEVTQWVYDGRVFVGAEAKDAGVVQQVVAPQHPNVSALLFLE